MSGSRSIAALFCLALMACTSPESSSTGATSSVAGISAEPNAAISVPRKIASQIEASKAELRSETTRRSSNGIDVSETRYFVGTALVLIEEIVGLPDSGGSVTAYYFDDERLVFFRGGGVRTIIASNSTMTRENFDIEIGYDTDGNVVESIKLIDGAPSALEPFDYEAPKARARSFLQQKTDTVQ